MTYRIIFTELLSADSYTMSACTDQRTHHERRHYFTLFILREILMRVLLTAICLTLLTSPVFAQPYKVDVSHSSVLFKVVHFNVGYTVGMFKKFKGSIDEGKSVEITIDASSVDSNQKKRDSHLRSPDFFNVKQFPEISFKGTKWETAEGGAKITGDLSFHGVTKSVSFFAKKVGEGDDPYGNHRIGYTAEVTVKRSEFGVTYGIKGNVAGDEITLVVSLEGVRKK